MSENKRRFFSGNTIQQAVMAAASAYGLDPREVNFQPVEKKRGFLKVRKRIIIEVDQEQPRLDEPRDELFNDGPKGLAPVIGEPVPGRKKEEPAAPSAEKAGKTVADEASQKKAEPPRRTPVEEVAEGSDEVEAEADEVRDSEASGVEEDEGRKPRRRGGRPERRRQDRRESQGREEAEDRSAGDDDSEEAAPRGRRPRQRRGRGGRNEESAKASKVKQRPSRIEGLSVEEEALARLLDLADLDLEWELWREDDVLHVELTGEDSDLVLSDEGSVLYSLEHLLPQLIRGIDGEDVFCQVDCDGYRKEREEELRELARNSAAWVVENDREKTLRELNPAERRIVHMELADHPDVETESEGRGYRKRLTIWPL